VRAATATELTMQARAPYAAIHQYGGTMQRKGGARSGRCQSL
jgi:phage gpG-like protein